MLSESDEERIKNEEFFRYEVRKSLDRNKKSSSLWLFLNSAFGIFVFSSIIIGGLSFAYQEWQDNIRAMEMQEIEARENNQVRDRLREETLVRLGAIQKLKEGAKLYESLNVWIAYWGKPIKDQTDLPFKYYNSRALFTKYENWTLFEVLAELKNYEGEFVRQSIDRTMVEMRGNIDNLNGGIYQKTRTNQGVFLAKGRYFHNSGEYITDNNETIAVSVNDLPLVKYFFAAQEQQELMNSIEELIQVLEKAQRF